MVLPQELQLYAENILRRFPEEFMALGAPGLEDIYDLRPNGTWSRRMMETSSEKTVEITLRRWHAPSLVNPQVAMGGMGYMSQAAAPYHHMTAVGHAAALAAASARGYAASPMAPYPPAVPFPSAEMAQADDKATQRLERLETALQLLKPQLEAVLTAQVKAQANATLPISQRTAGGGPPEDVNDKNYTMNETSALTPGGSLRTRRHMDKLAIVTSPQQKGQQKASVPAQQAQPPPAPTVQGDVSSDNGDVPAAKGIQKVPVATAGEKSRPKVINTVRVAPSDLDPKSPRSPGRYTAWS
mmetsp:Transcript_37486/g.67806  ORF Transcript_37486/g.67806 Transcript_37486/m.67806 type:complete len:299 (-) Transcript_37486:95-991(-)